MVAQRPYLDNFEDFDDFIDRGDKVDPKKAKAVEYNLTVARAGMARILWQNDVFVGVDAIDRLLYQIFSEGTATDPLRQFLDVLMREGVHKPGFIVYPLHSFGILGFGLFSFFRRTQQTHLSLAHAGIAVTAQQGKLDKTIAFLDAVRREFRVSQKLPEESIRHYHRSRHLHWLERNPLMAIKLASHSGSYYENQFIYVLKLRLGTALILMLSTVGKQFDREAFWKAGSSAKVNSWQTLDIHHYLTFERGLSGKSALTNYCIPMNKASLDLAHLSDLNTDIDPAAWNTPKARKNLVPLRDMLRTIETGYLGHVSLSSPHKVARRVFHKLMDSIDYFRRSFSADAKPSEQVVSLSIAFETLLIDRRFARISDRLVKRADICLNGRKNAKKLSNAVGELYQQRNKIVHSGRPEAEINLLNARRAYVWCLEYITRQLHALPETSSAPISELLGDALSEVDSTDAPTVPAS